MKNKLFFSLSFHNKDIYYIELDSINNNTVLTAKIAEANNYINELQFPEMVIVHLEQTKLNHNGINQIIDFILKTKKRYNKLCFVGIHGIYKLILYHKLNEHKKIFSIQWTIINDYQKAKEWIVAKQTR